MRLLLIWILNAIALLAVAYLLPAIHVEGFGSALIAALVLGLVNTLVRPVLVLLTLPVTLLTLGLFILVINGLLFWFVGSVLRGFTVDGFWIAVAGAILYSVISWALTAMLVPREPRN
jgi:putative membrane protein